MCHVWLFKSQPIPFTGTIFSGHLLDEARPWHIQTVSPSHPSARPWSGRARNWEPSPCSIQSEDSIQGGDPSVHCWLCSRGYTSGLHQGLCARARPLPPSQPAPPSPAQISPPAGSAPEVIQAGQRNPPAGYPCGSPAHLASLGVMVLRQELRMPSCSWSADQGHTSWKCEFFDPQICVCLSVYMHAYVHVCVSICWSVCVYA